MYVNTPVKMEQFVDINQIVEGCSSHDNLEQVLKLYSDNFVNNDYKVSIELSLM